MGGRIEKKSLLIKILFRKGLIRGTKVGWMGLIRAKLRGEITLKIKNYNKTKIQILFKIIKKGWHISN